MTMVNKLSIGQTQIALQMAGKRADVTRCALGPAVANDAAANRKCREWHKRCQYLDNGKACHFSLLMSIRLFPTTNMGIQAIEFQSNVSYLP